MMCLLMCKRSLSHTNPIKTTQCDIVFCTISSSYHKEWDDVAISIRRINFRPFVGEPMNVFVDIIKRHFIPNPVDFILIGFIQPLNAHQMIPPLLEHVRKASKKAFLFTPAPPTSTKIHETNKIINRLKSIDLFYIRWKRTNNCLNSSFHVDIFLEALITM